MIDRLRRTVLLLALVVPFASAAVAETVTLEFSNAPLAQILVALGRSTGVSIVPDETVSGRASYYVRDLGAEDALAELAVRFNLFVTRHDDIYSVSALRIESDEAGLLTVETAGVELGLLLERLSRVTRTPILGERLPNDTVSYFGERLSLPQILDQLTERLPDHSLSTRSGGYILTHRGARGVTSTARPEWVVRSGDEYSIASDEVALRGLLRVLFDAGGREYQLLTHGDPIVGPLTYSAKRFDDLLRLVLERGGATSSVVDGIYYITDAGAGAAQARAFVTETVALERLPVATLLDLLPPEQLVDVTVRPDRATDLVTLTGTRAAVARVRGLMHSLEASLPDGELRRIELSSVRPEELTDHLPPRLRSLQIVPVRESTAITAFGNADELDELTRVVALVDRPEPTRLVELRHLSVADLLANPPRGAIESQIVPTADPHRFFYVGTDTAYERFRDDLKRIDRPLAQIVYHLLVVQHQEGDGFEFDANLSNALTSPDAVQAFIGSIGNLLSFDFDVVSSFGYQFAARLDASLTESRAAIVADATLAGLSGESVSFRNTSTYRYRDVAVDPETGEPRSNGVVREIASGLILEITGHASDGFVTMDVAATISRRGTDTSGSGNPPPTSERVVRTRVRSGAGRPVTVGGLRLKEDELSTRRTPLVGRIPLVGLLFQGRREHTDLTDLAIYIIPYLVPEPDNPVDLVGLYERYYGEAQ